MSDEDDNGKDERDDDASAAKTDGAADDEKAEPKKAEAKKAEPKKAEAKKDEPKKIDKKKDARPEGRKHAAREATSEPPVAKAKAVPPKAGHHDSAEHRRTYVKIWGWLLLLTILEVGVAYSGGYVPKTSLVAALVMLALVKAGSVALFYMHLKYETKVMRWTVAFPMMFPALYAFILIAEGIYRAVWGKA